MSDATLVSTPTPNVLSAEPQPKQPHDSSSLISMREIWKTYQMGSEQVHVFTVSLLIFRKANTLRSSALPGRVSQR